MKLALILILVAAGLAAETFVERNARDRAANPADLRFELSVAGRRFHMGERIPITLAFSSPSANKYKLNGATYDRSGRLPTEEFVPQQEVPDPYRDYFGSGVMGFMGGGIRGYPVLESEPHRIELTLNDWFRFDRPGSYQFYVKSRRVSSEQDRKIVTIAPVSNIVEIEIAPPDPVWEGAELEGIREAVGEKRDEAMLALRCLAIPESVRLALAHSRRTGTQPDTLLLVGARDRRQMVADYDNFLTDPKVGFHEWAIRVRALFRYLDESKAKRFEDVVKAEAVRLIPAVRQKEGEAREASAEAIAALALEEARASGLVPPEDFGLTRAELIEGFDRFPRKQQAELLYEKWDLVRGPEMIPVLKRLIDAVDRKDRTDVLPNQAMRRLQEIAPGDATAILRSDMAGGKMAFAAFAVEDLPAQEVPDADNAFAAMLKTASSADLSVVAKFGTARLAGRMQELYATRSRWPCAEEREFVLYFLRVKPEGGDVLTKAMANREQRGCHRFLLLNIAREFWNGSIERLAITMLADDDPEAAANAAMALAQYGAPSVEASLWARLEQWSERWRGRSHELAEHPITGKEAHPGEQRFGEALFRAIPSAKAWRMNQARRRRLQTLCVDEYCRKTWSGEEPRQPVAINVSNGGSSYPAAFRVEGYAARSVAELEAKLSQYPAGFAFRWCGHPSPIDAFTAGQHEEMFQNLELHLAKRSIALIPYSEEPCRGGIVVPE